MEPQSIDATTALEEDWLREACDAAIHGNITKLCSCFGCDVNHNSSGLDDPLVHSPARVQQVQELLFSQTSSLDAREIQPPHALRALLMIPSSYEAPWLTACDVVEKSLHQKVGCLGSLVALDDKALILSLVTEIQSFFHQTVGSWWELERRLTSGHTATNNKISLTTDQLANTTPRQMLLRLAKIVMSPLISPYDATDQFPRDNRRWTLPLELLATMVSLFRDMEELNGQSFVSLILDVVFDDRLQPKCLLPWMTIVSDLRHNLRKLDWSRLRDLLCRSLAGQQHESMSIDVSDLPGLAKAIVTFVSTNDDNENFDRKDIQNTWQQLILHLLNLSSSNDATFSTVETVLQSSLATLPPPLLHDWLPDVTIFESEERSTIPNWIKVHLILLVSQASRQSGSQLISHLVSKALGVKGEGAYDISTQCWAKLVTLAFPKAASAATSKDRHRKRLDARDVVQEVERIFDGISYNRQGQLIRQIAGVDTEELAPTLTHAASLLRESIFLGSVSSRAQRPSYHIFFAERAQWWVHAANNAVFQPCKRDRLDSVPSLFDMIMAVVVTVVVYCEIPTSRSSVVRSILQTITVDKTDETPQLLYCTILSVIVRSLTSNNKASNASGLGALNPITDAFAHPVSRAVFRPLAIALSPLPSGRVSLLSFARKCLDTYGGDYHFRWVDEGSCERRDCIECGFYALCTLLGTLGDECSLEAWKMLSDFIVLRRPTLPCPARSMLFGCLLTFVGLKRLHVPVCKHMLRACLVTLCTYCSDSDGHLEIIPEHAFSTFINSKPGSKMRIVPREDLASLLRLTCSLLRVISLDDIKQRQAVGRERESLIRNILALQNNEIGIPFLTSKLDDRETLASVSTMCLIDALLRSVVKVGSKVSNNVASAEVRGSILTELVMKLLEDERDELNSLGLDWTADNQVPTWLGDVSLTSTGLLSQTATADRSYLVPVQLSFCDLLIELVLNPIWPMRDFVCMVDRSADELKHDVIACGFIVSQKLARKKIIANSNTSSLAEVVKDESLCYIARSCFRSSAMFLKSVFSSNHNLTHVEAALELALEVCEAIQGIKLDSEATLEKYNLDAHDLFRCIWELYIVVGTEECSIRFIQYIEETCGIGKVNLSISSRLCLARIETTEDVDNIVRTMRTSLLRAMLQCMSMITMNRLWSQRVIVLEFCPIEARAKAESKVSDLDAGFLSSALVMLCNDLRCGLDGKSGGVTNNLYLTYVESIEGIASLVYANPATHCDLPNPVLTSCRQGALLIQDILCSFPLHGAVLFKRSLRLALNLIPSLARSIGREHADGFVETSVSSGGEFWTTYGFANDVFVQCMDVHARWATNGMNATTPWFEIAGSEHCSSSANDEVDLPDKPGTQYPLNTLSCDDVPAVISIPTDNKNTAIRETRSQKIGSKIQLPVKECWSWACNGALSAMEENWMESLKAIMRTTTPDSSVESRSNSSGYLAARQEELGSMLQTIRVAFQQMEMSAESLFGCSKSKKDGCEMVLALMIPSSTKLRLCALLGRISFVLQRSVKLIQTSIRGNLGESPNDSLLDLGMVEALSCLSAWLGGKSDDPDFATLAKRWYRAEKKLQEVSQKVNAHHSGEDPVFRRFPKLLCRLEELESATQTLHAMICSAKDSDSLGKIRLMDELLKSSWEPSWDYEAGGNVITIRRLIAAKVKAISNSGSKLADFTNGPSSEQKRRSEKLHVRRRHIKRSRNELVDKWLQLDEELEDDIFDDDAYVELEDFLVDG